MPRMVIRGRWPLAAAAAACTLGWGLAGCTRGPIDLTRDEPEAQSAAHERAADALHRSRSELAAVDRDARKKASGTDASALTPNQRAARNREELAATSLDNEASSGVQLTSGIKETSGARQQLKERRRDVGEKPPEEPSGTPLGAAESREAKPSDRPSAVDDEDASELFAPRPTLLGRAKSAVSKLIRRDRPDPSEMEDPFLKGAEQPTITAAERPAKNSKPPKAVEDFLREQRPVDIAKTAGVNSRGREVGPGASPPAAQASDAKKKPTAPRAELASAPRPGAAREPLRRPINEFEEFRKTSRNRAAGDTQTSEDARAVARTPAPSVARNASRSRPSTDAPQIVPGARPPHEESLTGLRIAALMSHAESALRRGDLQAALDTAYRAEDMAATNDYEFAEEDSQPAELIQHIEEQLAAGRKTRPSSSRTVSRSRRSDAPPSNQEAPWEASGQSRSVAARAPSASHRPSGGTPLTESAHGAFPSASRSGWVSVETVAGEAGQNGPGRLQRRSPQDADAATPFADGADVAPPIWPEARRSASFGEAAADDGWRSPADAALAPAPASAGERQVAALDSTSLRAPQFSSGAAGPSPTLPPTVIGAPIAAGTPVLPPLPGAEAASPAPVLGVPMVDGLPSPDALVPPSSTSAATLAINGGRASRGPKLLAPPALSLGESGPGDEPEQASAADPQRANKMFWCLAATVISAVALAIYRRRTYGEIRP